VGLGCFRAQGFLLSRPIDGVAMGRLLEERFVPFSLNGHGPTAIGSVATADHP
jgi:hypothetical protein